MKALVFDLDGTLVDSVYQHVVAWQRAFASEGIDLAGLEIHRRIGMDGEVMLAALDRTFSLGLRAEQRRVLASRHNQYFSNMRDDVHLVAQADRIAAALEPVDVRWAIVTSGTQNDVGPFLHALHADRAAAVITSDERVPSKPAPHPLARAFEALGVEPHDAGVVGDSVWDMLASREAGSLGIGVLTGGNGRSDLFESGAFRVYRDIAELLQRLEEVGIQAR